MSEVFEFVVVILVGLSGGVAVGTGFVAFLAVLGIIPRLAQLSKTGHLVQLYEWAIIIGGISACWIGLRNISFQFFSVLLIPIGLFSGVFTGMLAAALTEVLNVMPILTKRVGVDEKLIILLMAIVLGKIAGTLFHWLYFIKQ